MFYLYKDAKKQQNETEETCEVFLCFVAIVRVRMYYAEFFVFFGLRHR